MLSAIQAKEREQMRDVAIVATSMVQAQAMEHDTEVEFMVPVISDVKQQVGMQAQDFGFVCSGSSDFLAGQAFSFVQTLDAVGAVPPISESHVEMDGAWALYEAWVKLQLGKSTRPSSTATERPPRFPAGCAGHPT